ncbi:hypothetical protein GCM10026987_34050 [Belliella aquatica]|uniref:Thioredoxin domain-containing protein n=2 Tax=Belliella aquatica TaxID=1323734 RepID=A0ABQ1LZ04_9BACT|nr:hypothetical protein GCM10010993_08100 [Belliella aquatica]
MLIFVFSTLTITVEAQLAESNQTKSVLIHGEILTRSPFDTLSLSIYEDFLGKMVKLPNPTILEIHAQGGDGFYGLPGQVAFTTTTQPLKGPAFATLTSKEHGVIFSDFLISPGDTVGVFLDRFKNRLVFTGPSASKYKIQKELDDALMEESATLPAYFPVDDVSQFLESGKDAKTPSYGIRSFVPYAKTDRLDYFINRLENRVDDHHGFDVIAKYQGILDTDFLKLLELNFLGKLLFSKVFSFNVTPKDDREAWSEAYLKHTKEFPEVIFDPKLLMYAPFYSDYLLEKYVADGYASKTRALDEVLAIENEPFRDRMLSKFIIRFYPVISKKDLYLDTAFAVMKDSTSINMLSKFVAGKKKGTEVPDFKLINDKNEEVGLHEFKGKAVFMDFWFTGCQACVLFNQNVMHRVEEHFSDNDNIQFLTVSIDTDYSKWQKSLQSGRYTTSHSYNLYTGGQGKEHPLLKYFSIHGFPSQVLLDKEGKILETSGLNKSADELIKIIEESINQKP